MSERKIDIYNHVMPRAIADRMRELAPGKGDMVKRVTSIPMLHDIEARVRMMEQWPGYQQVLTLSNPPLETIAGHGDTPDLARVANDELRNICAARPDKFTAWVASLPLNGQSVPQRQQPLAAERGSVQLLVRCDGNLAVIDYCRRLAAQRNSVVADDIDAHEWMLLIDPAAIPP